MELSLGIRVVLFVLFAIVVLVGIYLQLKYFQKNRDDRIDAKLERDDLYNSIVTAQAIADSLKNQGYDVGDSELTLEMAMLSFEQRNDLKTRQLVDNARKQMFVAKNPVEEAPFSIRDGVAPKRDDEIPRPKISESVIQAQFMMNVAISKGGDGVSELVAEAAKALDNGDEDSALTLANRARRMSEGLPPVPEDDDVDDGLCPECGGDVPPEYVFCGSCGYKVR